MRVNTAILAITHDRPSALIGRILEARLNGMTILEMPTVYEILTKRVPVEHIYDQWLLFTDGFYLVSKEYMQKVKRLIDFVVSALLLFGTLPITAISALAIRFESSGPIFFKQERVGKNGLVLCSGNLDPCERMPKETGRSGPRKLTPG